MCKIYSDDCANAPDKSISEALFRSLFSNVQGVATSNKQKPLESEISKESLSVHLILHPPVLELLQESEQLPGCRFIHLLRLQIAQHKTFPGAVSSASHDLLGAK